jgi:hypothetical protein
MALRVHTGKTNKQGLATAVRHAPKRSFEAVARRSIVAGALLAMVLLAMFAVESPSSGALTVPSVSIPSVSVPSVSVPPVSTPAVTVPTVSTPAVSVPSVSVPFVGSTPSLSVVGGQGASALSDSALSPSSASASAASGGAGQSGAGTSSVGSGRSAGDRGAHAPGSAAARQRQLRSLVVRLRGCLSTLRPQAQHVLLLRAGIGTARPHSGGAVAHILYISVVREAQVEHAALVDLQAAARDGRCASTSVALIQVPAQDRLVAVDAVLMNPGQSAGSARASGAIGAPHSQRTLGSRHRGPAIQNAAIAEFPTSNSSADPWVFGALVLLGALALLSAAGRRLAVRQRLAMSASAMALPVIAPASRAALKPNDAPAEAAASNEATAGQAPALATSNNTIVPEVIPPASSAAPESYEPGVTPAPTLAPRQAWLRTHRSQIALVLTAAGAALRLIARDRGRRRH